MEEMDQLSQLQKRSEDFEEKYEVGTLRCIDCRL